MNDLEDFHDEANAYLSYLADLLPQVYKLTLVARHTTMPPGRNADVVLTLDDPQAVIAALIRLFPPS